MVAAAAHLLVVVVVAAVGDGDCCADYRCRG